MVLRFMSEEIKELLKVCKEILNWQKIAYDDKIKPLLESIDEKILEELHTIKTVLVMANYKEIEKVLNEVVNTDNRHNMWVAMDGQNMPAEIADDVGVSAMAVSDFLKRVTQTGLVKYDQGKLPRKLVDYTPAS